MNSDNDGTLLRRGARGFDAGNIEALFVAAERELAPRGTL